MPPHNDSDAAVRRAHAAFSAAAARTRNHLVNSGVDCSAASSQLLDDLIAPCSLTDKPDEPDRAANSNSQGGSSSGVTVSSGGSGASPLQQHIVAATGASPAQAAKILLLREEISRLRRDGHSTATVIEQLMARLRDVPGATHPHASGWGVENAESNSKKGHNSKKRKGGGSADDPFDEKRRTDLSGAPIREGQFEPHAHLLLGGEGDHHHLDYSEENPIIGTGRLLSYPGEKAYSPPRRHHFTSSRSEGGADFGESLYETELKGGAPSDGKRLRAQGEDSAPLAQLKKLKLRGQQQSSD